MNVVDSCKVLYDDDTHANYNSPDYQCKHANCKYATLNADW